jgi:hypothetical protein
MAGNYRIASHEGHLMRHNDGSLIIMRDRDGDASEAEAVLTVTLRRVRPKRGEAWKTPDPAQEAFAQHVVDLLNAAETA